MKQSELITALGEKTQETGTEQLNYLRGLLQLKPLTYWDYIEVESLLSLQKPRTDFKDEEVFIMYHQVTELLLKLVLHEIRQLTGPAMVGVDMFNIGLQRMNRYTEMLINSFDIMKEGISYEDYSVFRCALAPASGFQSVQFRQVELHCTRLVNLVNKTGRVHLPPSPGTAAYFENMYWRDAGRDRRTGKKTLTLRMFEDKYLKALITLAEEVEGCTIEDKVNAMDDRPDELVRSLRRFDQLWNVEWPMVHLRTAAHFLDRKGETKDASGGSQWKKYLHPASQQRRFFPALWSDAEIAGWGLNGHE